MRIPATECPLPPGLNAAWEAFFQNESTRPIGLDFYPDIFSDPTLFPLQRYNEMAWMMRQARSISPRVVYEIGTDKGDGLYHWCKCLPSVQRVIACEIRGTPYSAMFEAVFPHIDFLWIEDSSYSTETLDIVRQWLNNQVIDCLFIDGDKAHFDTDFFAHRPFLEAGSLVFMHDIRDPAPSAGYHRARANYHWEDHIDISESLEAVALGEAGIPIANPHEGWLRHWKGASAGVGVIHI